MNLKQARKEGLQFTGHYESYSNSETIKQEAKNIRTDAKKLGYSVRVVMVDEGHGISLYADKEYFKYDKHVENIRISKYLVSAKNELIQKYEDAVSKAMQELEDIKKKIADAELLLA
jgi:hypothetical protein